MKQFYFFIKGFLFLLVFCCSYNNALAQAYYRVTDTTGTHSIGGINVTITDTGGVQLLTNQYVCDSIGPYNMLSASYTFAFSSPVKAITSHIVAINVGDTIDIYINGVQYYVTSANISCFVSSCSGQSNTVTTYNGELCGTICNSNADIQFYVDPGYPINSFQINERTAWCGGINFDFYFSQHCPGTAFTTPCTQLANICRGDTLRLHGSGTNLSSTATYSWTGPNGFTSSAQNPVIVNTPFADNGIFTLTIADTGGCLYSSSIDISVDSPAVSIFPDLETICPGSGATLYVYGGSVVSWSPTTGLSCICNQPTASPTTTQTYTVTASDGQGCTSTATATITVNPLPTLNPVSNQTFCDASASSVNFTGSAGTGYTWTNSNTSIGLGSGGSGNISFTSANSGSSAITATIAVTPQNYFNGLVCTGTPGTFTITVEPAPSVNTVSSQTLCNGNNTTAVTFSGSTVSGTTYNWTNSNTSIGLAASGSGNIASFTATNTGSSPVTATITVTPTANSCPGTPVTFTITVNPTPTITLGSNPGVCAGITTANLTYSATSASPSTYSIVYSSSANAQGFTNVTNATLTSSPISLSVPGTAAAATYNGTLTVASSAGCASANYPISITVKPIPAATISPANDTVCFGTTDTLHANTGTGLSYQWEFSGSLISGATNSYYVIPSSLSLGTYSYNVVVTLNGCSGTSSATAVNVLSAVAVTASINLNKVFNGQSVVLSAANCPAYSWSPAYSSSVTNGVVCPTCALTVAVPVNSSTTANAVNTYKVIGNYYGCLDSTTVSVTVLPLNDTMCNDSLVFNGSYITIGASSSVVNSTFSGGNNFYALGDLNVAAGTNVSISNKIIMMAPGAHIFIYGNSSLTLNHCHLLTCPVSLYSWKGIYQYNSSSLYLSNNTLIEDADTAVRVEGTISPASGFTYVLSSDGAIFNRNYAAIELFNQATPNSMLIRNTVFTSRNFIAYNDSSATSYPLAWPPVTGSDGLKTAYNPASGYQAPYNADNPAALFGTFPYPPVLCKDGDSATYGITIDSVGSTDLTTSPPTITAAVQIGDNSAAKQQNLFDNTNYGIHASYSNITSVNNAFLENQQTALYAESFINPCITPVNQSFFGQLQVGGTGNNQNRFYDCSTGVEANGMYNVIAQNNYMISNHTTATLGSQTNYGYKVYGWYMNTMNMTTDTIVNISNGAIVTWFTSMGESFEPQANITGNEIRATLPGEPYQPGLHPNRYVQNGIQLMGIIPFPPGNGGGAPAHIDNNRFMDVYNGIYASSEQEQQVTSNKNNIVLVSDSLTATQYGIWHANCVEDSVFENPNIHGLDIWGSANADNVRAFLMSSSNPIISCNWEDSLGRGFEFSGTCSGTTWFNNTMDTNMEGLYLNNGLIGTQGTAHDPISDVWDASWSGTNYNTFVYGTPSALFDTLYVLPTSTNDPSNNWGFPYSGSYSPINGLANASGSSPINCGTRPPHWNYLAPFHNIAFGNIDYGTSTAIRAWIGQYYLWQMLQVDSSLVALSPILQRFQIMASTSRYAYMSNIENYIGNGDLSDAYALASTCPTPNPQYDPVTGVLVADSSGATHVVANYLKFYKILISYLGGTISDAEKDTLTAMSGLCPTLNGTVVYQARALYAMVYNTAMPFNDDVCYPPEDGGKAANSTNSGPNATASPLNLLSQKQHYVLSPNPNNGNMILVQTQSDPDPVRVEVLNMLGQSVYHADLLFNGGKAQLNMQGNAPGFYVLQLTDSKGNTFICKFVISD